jgi:hypothetical protein
LQGNKQDIVDYSAGGVTDRQHIADCKKFIHFGKTSALSVCDLGSTKTLHLRATNLRMRLAKWHIAKYNVHNILPSSQKKK